MKLIVLARRNRASALLAVLLLLQLALSWPSAADEQPDAAAAAEKTAFKERVQPLLKKYCVRCHNADNLESGIRVDQLTASLEDQQIPLWKGIQKLVMDEAMPPEDEPQPTAEQRKSFDTWITRAITAARSRPSPKNGSVR